MFFSGFLEGFFQDFQDRLGYCWLFGRIYCDSFGSERFFRDFLRIFMIDLEIFAVFQGFLVNLLRFSRIFSRFFKYFQDLFRRFCCFEGFFRDFLRIFKICLVDFAVLKDFLWILRQIFHY